MSKQHLLQDAQSSEALEKEPRVKALLVGPSKGGKSTSAVWGWPESYKKLVIEMDGREQSLAGAPNTEIVRVHRTVEDMTGWDNLLTIKDDLWSLAEGGDFPYDVVIYDGLSSMRRITMDYCLNLRGNDGKLLQRIAGTVPTIAHVQPHTMQTTNLIFNQLALPCHVIFTGHFYQYEDQNTNKIETWPSMLGTTMRNECGTWFDEVYHCYGEKTKDGMKYYWQTQPNRKLSFLGSTMNKMNKYWTDPIEVNFDERPAGFELLLKTRYGMNFEGR